MTDHGPDDVTIWHNPGCGTSRNVLAMIRATGTEPRIIEYLKTPPTRAKLAALIDATGLPVRAFVRKKGALYGELGLDDPAFSDDALIDALIAHPPLIERPIVETAKGVRLGRPADVVIDILPRPLPHDLAK